MGATARDCPIGVKICMSFPPNLGKGVGGSGVWVLILGVLLSIHVCVE